MIKVVLFDLGSTLIHARIPWTDADFWRRGDAALVQVLRDEGFNLDVDAFDGEHGTFLDRYYARRKLGDTTEQTAFSMLTELVFEKGFSNIPTKVLRAALDAMYTSMDGNWILEEDAISTLETLKIDGYRLGLISNTSDDPHVQRLIDAKGLRPFFEYVLTSAGFGIRKPDARIFQAALDFFQVGPGASAMVGDTVDADVLGANEMGIYSIWIKRRSTRQNPNIIPKAIVESLLEIPTLLRSLG